MSFTNQGLGKISLVLPYPTKHKTMRQYRWFIDYIKLPELLPIADFTMMASNSVKHLTEEMCYEWMENYFTVHIYEQAEMESWDEEFPSTPDEMMKESYPINCYLHSMASDVAIYQQYHNFLKSLATLWNELYGNVFFPEKLADLDPFYQCDIRMINSDSLILEITEKEDVEFFSDCLSPTLTCC